MSQITLRQLEFFVAVVEEQSITMAAERLHVSPGGVSIALTELESSLKLQLTLRQRGRGVVVTPAGRWVYDHARSTLAGVETLQSAASIMRGELSGPLRIGCFTTLSPWLVPRILGYFTAHHPAIDIQLVEGTSAALQDKMKEGELDVALVYSNHLQSGITGTEIIPVRLQLAVATTHRLAALDEVPLSELEHEDAILLGVQPAMGHVEDLLRGAGIHPRVRWRSTNVETIRSMVARGLGYTIIMGRPYGDYTYDGLPLAYRRIADDIPRNAVVVSYPDGMRQTASMRELVDFCRNEFADEGNLKRQTYDSGAGMGEL